MTRILLALLCALLTAATAAPSTDTPPPPAMKTLVVYYSLTGKTEAVAQALAQELGADLRRVQDVTTPPAVSWWFILTHALAALRGEEADIQPIDTSLQGYDRVYVGAPVWGGSPATPINTFLARADFSGKEVVVFMTMGGNDAAGALRKLSERIEKKGGRVVGSFALSSKDVSNEELAARTREAARRFR